MAKDPYRYFRIEARELLDQLSHSVLDLEKANASGDLVPRLLRLAHTLKGAARVVRQTEIAELIHGVEDSLAPHRDTASPVPREQVDGILAALDAINRKLAQLGIAQDSDAIAPATTVQVQDVPARIAHADVAEVDELLQGLGEIGGELEGMRASVAAIEHIRNLTLKTLTELQSPSSKTRALSDDIQDLLSATERNMAASVERIDRELRQARDAAERLRLVPAASIFHALERTARDAAHNVGKQILFEARGGEVRIDGQVLDSVQSALVQLVRNAVAHGIEAVADRQALGKPPAGSVTLEIIRRGYRAWFRCSDDGRGVDLEAVRQALLKKGARAADTQGLDAAQLLSVLLKGGITTSNTITELAGRGVGLDVVREAAQRINGDIVAQTTPGRGTTIELRVPLSLASMDVVTVEANGQIVAIPLDSVRRTVRVAMGDIVHSPEGASIANEGNLIPLLALDSHDRHPNTKLLTAVIVSAGNETLALAVTRLCGIDTVVLRPLPTLAPAEPIVLGLHLDTEGTPRMVLDPEQFMTLRRPKDTTTTQPQTPLPILIIDDSLTTRMLESSILESAGFLVEMASSAEDGLAMARGKRYALFLVDVEMPGMDGFGFVAQTRADPALREVPSILVTSRDAPEDRQRGAAVGASAYIVKGEFDQVEFLQSVAKLVVP
ncbi:MAG: response regulator [Pseudomonadota bacterium]